MFWNVEVILSFLYISVGRTNPNLDDLGLAFAQLGIPLGELEEYLKYFAENVPYPKEQVAFPVSRPDNLHFPRSGSKELRHRPEYVHEHLPVMNREWGGAY
jgi:transcription initiation factor TFIID subunit 3